MVLMVDVKKLIARASTIAGNQNALAAELGVTRQMISRWKKGGGMSLVHYERLIKYLEQSQND
jgi:DNA-binding XRE family transcriptional regulator